MKLKHKDIEGSRRLFEIEFPQETVKKKYEEIFDQIKKTAHIPGYRAGKAPRDLLEKFHGKRIKDEVIQDLVLHSLRHALSESQTQTLGTPEVRDLDFDLKKGLFFKIEVDIRPTVRLKRYKNLAVKKQKIEVKPVDVDRYLSILRESNASFNDVNDRAVRMGDYIVCDLECLVDEKPIYPKRKGVWIFVDKSNPVPGLIEGVIGLKTGEKREINATLPKDFQDEKYRGKEARFKINLLKVKEKQLPELDDEFAKRLGKYDKLEDLKKAVELDLTGKLETNASLDMENQILATLLKETDFPIPNELVERETKRLAELRKNEKISREKAKEEAVRRVKSYFILDEVAKQEKIEVSEEELDKTIEALAKEYGKTKEELIQYYKKKNLVEGLRDQLKERKVIEFLLGNANVKKHV